MAHTNREVRDRLFKKVFEDKKDLLSLYNALNNTAYDDPDAIEITTIDDVIYMGMKNDLSFIISSVLNVYEQQSTYNPNMPLRSLLYIAKSFESYMTDWRDVHGSRLVRLPNPQPVVFYNGNDNRPDKEELLLSDAYVDGRNVKLELKVLMFNINEGRNADLMEHCQKLKEYSLFVSKLKECRKKCATVEEAVDETVDYCIEHDILKSILAKNRAEVRMSVLTEYDEEFHIKCEKEWSREDGMKENLINNIRKFSVKMSMPIEQVMDILEVPESERADLLEQLSSDIPT